MYNIAARCGSSDLFGYGVPKAEDKSGDDLSLPPSPPENLFMEASRLRDTTPIQRIRWTLCFKVSHNLSSPSSNINMTNQPHKTGCCEKCKFKAALSSNSVCSGLCECHQPEPEKCQCQPPKNWNGKKWLCEHQNWLDHTPKAESWADEFRKTFAEYTSHSRLSSPAFIVWAEDFIGETIAAKAIEEYDLGFKRGGNLEKRRILEMLEEMKERFKCAACGGAKCNHTMCCQALADIKNKLCQEQEVTEN